VNDIGFIGDIHGDVNALRAIVPQALGRARHLVFLGDYVDRGRYSRSVLDHLCQLSESSPNRVTFLAGHHDVAFLSAIKDGNLDDFLLMGGAETLLSYIDKPRNGMFSF
jgi:serine/threonine protein phosphatase 1